MPRYEVGAADNALKILELIERRLPRAARHGGLATSTNSGGVTTGGGTPAAATGRYRTLLYELDGAGGFEFLVDADGHPFYELMEVE